MTYEVLIEELATVESRRDEAPCRVRTERGSVYRLNWWQFSPATSREPGTAVVLQFRRDERGCAWYAE